MRSISIRIFHAEIEFISDRTARDLLKKTAKIFRKSQIEEINYILKDSDVSRSEYQSLTDKVKNFAEEAPLYDLQKLQHGSLELTLMAGAFMLWFLQNTLGETIKDGWKESHIHHRIINYIKNDRAKKMAELIDQQKDEIELDSDLEIRKIEYKKTKRKDEILIYLSTSRFAVKKYEKLIDGDFVVHEIEERLKSLEDDK